MKYYIRNKGGLVLMVLCFILSVMGCGNNSNTALPATTNATTAKTDNGLIVGTFNIDVKAKENVTAAQRELLASYGVEVFGIQEVDKGITRFGIDAYDPLVDFQQDPYTDSDFGLSIAKGIGGYGNGIISQYPLSDFSVTRLYGVEEAPEDIQQQYFKIYENYDATSEEGAKSMLLVWGDGGLVSQGAIEPRSYSRAVFEKNGKQIAFYSTHLSVESLEIRTKQLLQLKETLDNDPVEYQILVGDFNTDEGINEYNVFTNAGYKIANGNNGVWLETMAEKDSARESLETSMRVKFLDNIIVSDNISFETVESVVTDLSDHYPLIAKLILN